MRMTFFGSQWAIFLTAAGVLLFGGACKKKPANDASSTTNPPAVRPSSNRALTSRVHWLGMKGVSADPKATNFLSIWNLPASKKLVHQTLDKLSVAPWRPLHIGTNAFATNAAAALLRPFLEDLVQEEGLFEFRGDSADQFEGAIAVRIGKSRELAWRKDLKAVLKALDSTISGFEDTKTGWVTKQSEKLRPVQYSHLGEWIVLGLGGQKSELFNELSGRINRNELPTGNAAHILWIEGNLDLGSMGKMLGLGEEIASQLPAISFVTGAEETGAVRSQAQFALDHPRLQLPPWDVPTNIIYDPLASFTALRGLEVLRFSRTNFMGHPAELFFWAQGGVPFATYCALPLTNAGSELSRITNYLLGDGEMWLKSSGMGDFRPLTNGNGIAWLGLPILAPRFETVIAGREQLILAALGPLGPTNRPGPNELFRQVSGSTNVVYYDWENTASRTESWIEIAQLFRVIFHKPQLPFASPGAVWLKDLGPLLGNAVTLIKQGQNEEFTLARTSTIGLTSVELHLLMDWLESPDFPRGLHTFSK